MLHLLFPPRIVESLVSPLVNSMNSSAAASMNDVTAANRLASGPSPAALAAANDSPLRPLSRSLSPNAQAIAEAVQAHFAGATAALQSQVPSAPDSQRSSDERSIGERDRLRKHSPFAAASINPPPASPPQASSIGRPCSSCNSDRERDLSETLTTSSSLMAGGHLAGLLRDGPLHTDTSLLLSDDPNNSSAGSEIEGYEDLLEDDTKAHAARRPSQCLDRALSHGVGSRNPGSPHSRGRRGYSGHLDGDEDDYDGGKGPTGTASTTVTTWAADHLLATDAAAAAAAAAALPAEGEQHGKGWKGRAVMPYEGDMCASPPHFLTALSTISESRSAGSASDTNPNSLTRSPRRKLSAESSISGVFEQEWDLAFRDARVERSFDRHMAPKLFAFDKIVGVVLGIGGLALHWVPPLHAWALCEFRELGVLGEHVLNIALLLNDNGSSRALGTCWLTLLSLYCSCSGIGRNDPCPPRSKLPWLVENLPHGFPGRFTRYRGKCELGRGKNLQRGIARMEACSHGQHGPLSAHLPLVS